MRFIASPNFDKRAEHCPVEYIIVHYTGMRSTEESLENLTNPASKVSSHYLIDEAGNVTQMVDERLRAWHAGESFWQGKKDINSRSIGIELSNLGHEFGYQDFPELQLVALENLLSELFNRYNLPPSALLGHSDIAPTRKQDPGEKFPWERFAKKGFGLWSAPSTENNEEAITNLLQKIGYDCSEASAALIAFQRHYCTEELEQGAGTKTMAMLYAITRLAG